MKGDGPIHIYQTKENGQKNKSLIAFGFQENKI